ncbi:hypothetical protein L1049_000371 [Liquidambar formosana]|uniref:Glycoside hydrolase family 31 TIM barrel domain-containing protein n=1 Tax=Liquidambar formosana TaxID=63359 RepID=A0AAP0NC81_LIQFO
MVSPFTNRSDELVAKILGVGPKAKDVSRKKPNLFSVLVNGFGFSNRFKKGGIFSTEGRVGLEVTTCSEGCDEDDGRVRGGENRRSSRDRLKGILARNKEKEEFDFAQLDDFGRIDGRVNDSEDDIDTDNNFQWVAKEHDLKGLIEEVEEVLVRHDGVGILSSSSVSSFTDGEDESDHEEVASKNTDLLDGVLSLFEDRVGASSYHLAKVCSSGSTLPVISCGQEKTLSAIKSQSGVQQGLVGKGEDPISAHNRYPELWAQINREFVEEWKANRLGKEREDPEEALVFFMRAGFRDSPKWGMLFWERDQMVSWQANDGIKSAVVALLSSGISIFAFNHSDTGGYCTVNLPFVKYRRTEELLMRWMELNAFTTVFRAHEKRL